MSDLQLKEKQALMVREGQDTLPDVSHDREAEVAGVLDRVGMGQIEMPIVVSVPDGAFHHQPAKIDAFVSLDDINAKGIHMSRLYLTLQQVITLEPIGLVTLKKILSDFVDGQQGLSCSSMVRVKFELPLKRKALVSEEEGWRQYPITLEGHLKNGQYEFVLGVEVAYSSTCPCSAALARQMVQEKFVEDFASKKDISKEEMADWLAEESSIVATPHAQRSYAEVKLKVTQAEFAPQVVELIDLAEKSLGTPVQAAVKRKDEQEFARLNGENLMFCEDAARKLKKTFKLMSQVSDFYIRVEHQESLHPHNAVAEVVKGVEGGFSV